MRRALLLALFLLLIGNACAEDAARRVLDEADLDGIADFAEQYGAQVDVRGLAEIALEGDVPDTAELWRALKRRAAEPVLEALHMGRELLGPILLLALLRCALPEGRGGSSGAGFLLRLMMLLGFSEMAAGALEASATCIRTAKALTGAAAPALTALLAAMGMTGTSALVSPAAALAGDAAEGLFLNWGMPLCHFALCAAIAGNLSSAVDLSGASKLMRKAANWGVAVRTAKFAVDSAAPVIGSGVSDAWDSYVSGVLIAKNAVGLSGIAALFGAALRPLIACAAAMLVLNLLSALLSALGERDVARAAEEVSGICQMGLSLATGAVTVATVLLGAAMAAGGNLAG